MNWSIYGFREFPKNVWGIQNFPLQSLGLLKFHTVLVIKVIYVLIA